MLVIERPVAPLGQQTVLTQQHRTCQYSDNNNGCSSTLLVTSVTSNDTCVSFNRIPPHVESNPQDVVWEDHYGSTALHVLCRSENIGEESLLRAVDAILKEAPFLAGQPNRQTWTPLHLACDKRLLWRTSISTDEMVLKLIAACPAAVSRKLETGFKAKTSLRRKDRLSLFDLSCFGDEY